jgi:hypothetical protein
MKYIAIFLCLVGLVVAQGYTEWQQGAAEGLKIGFEMGQAYEKAQNGIDISGFNAQVDTYNAWVIEHFGQDPRLLMQKMTGPVDLQKPVLLTNNTTLPKEIIHKIDGNTLPEGIYTTNDMNLLPESALRSLAPGEGNYLGGV